MIVGEATLSVRKQEESGGSIAGTFGEQKRFGEARFRGEEHGGGACRWSSAAACPRRRAAAVMPRDSNRYHRRRRRRRRRRRVTVESPRIVDVRKVWSRLFVKRGGEATAAET